MNFLENGTLNLPFFLLNSLRRMETNVQKKVESIGTTLYHHGLVKILVEFHLRSVWDTWEDFLVKNFCQDAPDLSKGSPIKRSRRRNISIKGPSQKDDAEIALKPKVREQNKQKRKMKERLKKSIRTFLNLHHLKKMNNFFLKD